MKRMTLWLLLFVLLSSRTVLAAEDGTFVYYESAYPHCGVYEVTDSATGQVSYRIDSTHLAPWESHFMPYRWETRLPYLIWEKRFSNLPGIGWVEQEIYPQMNVTEGDIFRIGGCERVEKTYRLFGFWGFRIVGENRVAPAKAVYDTYPVKPALPDLEFFSPENLSKKDKLGNYLISDNAIASRIPLFDSAYLTGRNYAKGGTMTIDVADEILKGADPMEFDPSVLQPSRQKHEIRWELTSEQQPPYRQLEVLCLNGILLDGRTENGVKLPFIYRYNGKVGKVEKEPVLYQDARVYAFTYHWISPDSQNWGDYTITAEKFREDIRYLYENGYYFATPGELYAMGGKFPAEKIALITFDDGYASCYTEALPILEQYGAKATVYLVGSYIDTPDYLSTEQLKELAKSPLIELGNHSYELHNLPREQVQSLYRNDPDAALADYYQNETHIFSLTGKTLTTLSYPYGIYTTKLNQFLRDHGYEVTVSTRAASNHSTNLKTPLNRLNRSFYTSAEELIGLFGNKK